MHPVLCERELYMYKVFIYLFIWDISSDQLAKAKEIRVDFMLTVKKEDEPKDMVKKSGGSAGLHASNQHRMHWSAEQHSTAIYASLFTFILFIILEKVIILLYVVIQIILYSVFTI